MNDRHNNMTYREAKKFKESCTVLSGLTTPTAENLILQAPDGSQWYWFDSFLEYPEDGWSLTRKQS